MEVSVSQKESGKNNFVKKSAWLFFAKLVPTFTFLLITILYSRQLAYNAYGVFQSVWMLTNVGTVLLGFGSYSVLLSSGLPSLIRLVKDARWKVAFFFLLLLVAVISFVALSLSHQSGALSFLVLGVIVLHTLSFIFESILLRSGKEKEIFWVNVWYALLYFGWHVNSLYTTFEMVPLVGGVAFLGLFRLLAYAILSKSAVKDQHPFVITIQHWFFIGFNEVVGVLAKWLDKLLLVFFLAPAEFAVFFNGSIEIPLFGILVSVIGSIMLVEISANLAHKKTVIQTFRESFHLLSAVVFPSFWFLFFFRSELFSVVFDNRYTDSLPIFVLTILIIPVRVTHYTSVLQCYNKAHLILKGSLLDIAIALTLMPLLYALMGIKGVALAIVISTYIQSYYYLHHAARVLQTRILTLVPVASLVIRFCWCAILIGAFHYFIQTENDLVTLLYALFFIGVIVILGLYVHLQKGNNQFKNLFVRRSH